MVNPPTFDARNPKQPRFGCVKLCEYWDKLPYQSTGAGFLPSTVFLPLVTFFVVRDTYACF